jgi:signal transduction histidine kinase
VTSFVRAAWELPRAPGAPARVWRDWALVGVLVALTLIEAAARPGLPWLWTSVAIQLGLIATLLWRRTHPALMVVIALGSGLLVETIRQAAGIAPTELYSMAFVLILPYALVRWGSGRELMLGGLVIVIGLLRSLLTGPPSLEETVGSIAVLTATATLGAVFRARANSRVQRIERARLQERERLARDLHDTVAHRVSAIAIRAQAGLATSGADASAATDALQVIESEAVRALREMRALVRVLRDDDDPALSPVAGFADLAGLASPGSVPPVSVTVEGDVATVSATLSAALYRIAQESITNARRHATDATKIEVTVRITDEVVGIRVHDDGRAPASPGAPGADTPERGYGIVGMRERALVLGGDLRSGPDAGGGWTVAADFPLAGGAR